MCAILVELVSSSLAYSVANTVFHARVNGVSKRSELTPRIIYMYINVPYIHVHVPSKTCVYV